MKIDVEVKKEEQAREYPYIGIVREGPNAGCLVLFTKQQTGTVIRSNASWWELGLTLNNWDETCFDVFYGTITVKP